MIKKIVLAVVLILLLGGLGGGYFAYRFTHTPASSESRSVIFEVLPSMSFNAVADELQKAGVIKNAKFFYLFARVKGQRSHLKMWEYELNTNMLPGEILSIITSGKSRTRPFIVPEGYNIFEVADLFEKQGFGKREEFLSLATDKALVKSLLGHEYDSFEGYLFPENYPITKYMTARDVITAMVHRFQTVYNEVSANAKLPGWSTHQVVTLASIVEKETGAPEERKIISSVFHNRLVKKMKLQTDPTIIYGIANLTGKIPANIHKEDLLKPTRYNTYVIEGLPPGPISNPGKDALIAALNPDTTEFLYFVSQNNGTHLFTKTYEDHLGAVKKFQIDPKAREGKSWRDLKKNKK